MRAPPTCDAGSAWVSCARRISLEDVLDFIIGFIIWTVIGIVVGSIMVRAYRTAGTEPLLTVIFGFLGAFVGGMLGTSAHVFHDATPLRAGGIVGALFGAVFFSWLYHFIERKAV